MKEEWGMKNGERMRGGWGKGERMEKDCNKSILNEN